MLNLYIDILDAHLSDFCSERKKDNIAKRGR